ncbi:MAG: hypothetical protein FJX61_02650 [Alphaproteobacteria bacterium]|nr:hypothetical protein [Alphaproteobacteria bacterium]
MFRLSITALIAVFLSAGAASIALAQTAEWRVIDAADGKIMIGAGDLGLTLHAYGAARETRDGGVQLLERGQWRTAVDAYPRLDVWLTTSPPLRSWIVQPLTLPDDLAKAFFPSDGVAIDKDSIAEADHGGGTYFYFRLPGRELHCFGFRRYARTAGELGKVNERIDGYYCDRADRADRLRAPGFAAAVLAKIDIRGRNAYPPETVDVVIKRCRDHGGSPAACVCAAGALQRNVTPEILLKYVRGTLEAEPEGARFADAIEAARRRCGAPDEKIPAAYTPDFIAVNRTGCAKSLGAPGHCACVFARIEKEIPFAEFRDYAWALAGNSTIASGRVQAVTAKIRAIGEACAAPPARPLEIPTGK